MSDQGETSGQAPEESQVSAEGEESSVSAEGGETPVEGSTETSDVAESPEVQEPAAGATPAENDESPVESSDDTATGGSEGESADSDSPVEASDTHGEPAPSERESLEGFKLDEMGGSQVGRVTGVLVGEGGDADWLVARMGRFGHFCLVPATDCVAVNGRVWVPYSRDQIRRAPRVDPGGPPPADVKQATLEHYGLATHA